jgi:hypothetical protein
MTFKISILLVLTFSTSFAQTFEGTITYQNTYSSKMLNLPTEQFTAMMGTTQRYSLKEGDYKSVTNGTLFEWQLYINKDNKLYSKMANAPTLLYNDGSENKDVVLKAEINKGVVVILGYTCDELILTCKTGVQKFYFNSKLKVDPKLFENHKLGNWNEVLSRTQSLPLKIILDTTQFYLESLAVEIKAMKLDASLFELPAGSKAEKSPY